MSNIKNKTYDLKDGVLTVYDLPAFDDECFCYDSDIIKVYLPDGLKEIPGGGVFSDFSHLREIRFPDSLEFIGSSAFWDCYHLKNIIFPEKLEKIDDSAFYHTALQEIVIPENVQIIGRSAFAECRDLRQVNVEGHSLTDIDICAFYDCPKLESVILPESIEFIGEDAFAGCTSLKELVIPSTSQCFICSEAFKDCTNLREITLGAGVGTIKWDAFENCKNLKRINFIGGQPRIWLGTFNGISDDAVIEYKGKEVNMKDFREALSASEAEVDGFWSELSDDLFDEAITKQANKRSLSDVKKEVAKKRETMDEAGTKARNHGR